MVVSSSFTRATWHSRRARIRQRSVQNRSFLPVSGCPHLSQWHSEAERRLSGPRSSSWGPPGLVTLGSSSCIGLVLNSVDPLERQLLTDGWLPCHHPTPSRG